MTSETTNKGLLKSRIMRELNTPDWYDTFFEDADYELSLVDGRTTKHLLGAKGVGLSADQDKSILAKLEGIKNGEDS